MPPPSPRSFGEQRNEQSNRTAPNNRNRFTSSHRPQMHVMHCDGQRFHHGRTIVQDCIRHLVQPVGGHGPELLERPIRINPEKAQMLANMSQPAAASSAMAARDGWLPYDTIPGFHDPADRCLGNDRDHFMPQNSSWSGAMGHAALKDQKIASAN